MADYYTLAQGIKAGQVFVYGRGGKQWLALADADTTNMSRRVKNGQTMLYVSIPVSSHGVVQSMPLSVPLDRIIRLATLAPCKHHWIEDTAKHFVCQHCGKETHV